MALLQRQAQRKTDNIKKIAKSAVTRGGWIRYMRDALMLSAQQLADRVGCAQSTISELEKRERLGTVSLKKLREVADVMDCELVYGLVPRTPLAKTIDQAATYKARHIITAASTHMALEDQEVKVSLDDRVEALKEQLIAKKDVW